MKLTDAAQKSIIAKQKENEEKMKHLREIEGLKTLNDAQKSELEQMIKENEALAEELVEKERAKSMAELTKAGHIYVVSNIGSFGENIFKVGMTRRLIPEDRVDELGDASVPFPFDIHMMIATENAPSLEKVLHDSLDKNKLNCVNGRKEFFQTDLVTIKELIDKHSPGTKYHFTEVPLATQWRESQIIRSKLLKANQNKEAA